ncbi:AMP-binding protein [Saccharothrix syringae]|uniref:AMP-dependent synthetase n=1 Tax=Saccharothrix syringae TaxID=103733 RepID=A0A5Q0H368_SACSY|nr:AMP-binding protein [Saccharothrix syringae]QFZ20678.1 AMP-dependent synthetase [Saccharothrix syringae]
MSWQVARDHRQLVGWLADPTAERGVRFRGDDGTWRRWTYAELAADAVRAGHALADAGVRAGDVVPMAVPAGPDFVTHFFGVLALGATPSVLPLPWALRGTEAYLRQVRAITGVIRPAHAVVAAQYRDLLADGLAGARLLEPSYLDGGDLPFTRGEAAVLQFTSGSRGDPRGLRISVANMAANLRMIQRWMRLDRYGAVCWLPLYHDMGLVGGLLSAVTAQLEHALMQPAHFLRDPAGWLAEYGRTPYHAMVMPNFGFRQVLEKVRPEDLVGVDLSHLRTVISGAERIDPDVLSRFAALLEPTGFDVRALMPAYGLAEGTLAVSGDAADRVPRLVHTKSLDRRLGEPVEILEVVELGVEPVAEPWQWQVSCGLPLAGLTVHVLDEDGVRQPEGVLGEIYVEGPSVADGYLDPTAEDAARLGGGRLHTRDAGFLLDGELYVVGRLGDSVKVNGQSVFVEDVEQELRAATSIPDRHLAVVAGIEAGTPTVLLVTEKDPGDDLDALLAVLQRSGGPGARILVRHVARGTIPLTSSGKPRRRALWLAYLAGELPPAGGPTS